MSNTQIQRLSPQDAVAYRALRLQGLREHPEAFTSSFEEDKVQPLDAAKVRLSGGSMGGAACDAFFGAWQGEQLVGVVGLLGKSRIKERHLASVVGTFVAPQARGLGLGAALMQTLLVHARSCEHLVQLELSVTAGNTQACELYERLGFGVWGRCPSAICVIGVYFDKWHMVLRLH